MRDSCRLGCQQRFAGPDELHQRKARRADMRARATLETRHDVIFSCYIELLESRCHGKFGGHQIHRAYICTPAAADTYGLLHPPDLPMGQYRYSTGTLGYMYIPIGERASHHGPPGNHAGGCFAQATTEV